MREVGGGGGYRKNVNGFYQFTVFSDFTKMTAGFEPADYICKKH